MRANHHCVPTAHLAAPRHAAPRRRVSSVHEASTPSLRPSSSLLSCHATDAPPPPSRSGGGGMTPPSSSPPWPLTSASLELLSGVPSWLTPSRPLGAMAGRAHSYSLVSPLGRRSTYTPPSTRVSPYPPSDDAGRGTMSWNPLLVPAPLTPQTAPDTAPCGWTPSWVTPGARTRFGWGPSAGGALTAVLGPPPLPRLPPPLPDPRTTPSSGWGTSGADAANAHPGAAAWPPGSGAARPPFCLASSPLPSICPFTCRPVDAAGALPGTVSHVAVCECTPRGELGRFGEPQCCNSGGDKYSWPPPLDAAHAGHTRWMARDTSRDHGWVKDGRCEPAVGAGCQAKTFSRAHRSPCLRERLAPSTWASSRQAPLTTQSAQQRGPKGVPPVSMTWAHG